MLSISFVANLSVPGLPDTAPLADLEIVTQDGQISLIAASAAGGGMAGFAVQSGATARFVNYRDYGSGDAALSGVGLSTWARDDQAYILTAGPGQSGRDGTGLRADGGLRDAGDIRPASGTTWAPADIAPLPGGDRVVTRDATGTQLTTYRVGADLTVTAEGDPLRLAPAEAVHAMTVVQGDVVVTVQAGRDAVQTLRVGADGALREEDSLGAEDGLGLNTPTALTAVEVAGQSYVVVAGSGSSSLSVLRVASDGGLRATDHVLDDLHTRFAGVSQLAVIDSDGWHFVVAAGSDDGLSLFALLPGGRLFHLTSLASTAAVDLSDPAAVTGVVTGDQLQLFVVAEGQTNLTQLRVDLSGLGALREGSGAALSGTGADDILIAGHGGQVLSGGAGADTFVFLPERADASGSLGRVADYTPGTDRLDLSALPLLRDVGQITFESGSGGLVLRFGAYHVTLTGSDLRAEDFTTRDLINLQHVAPGPMGGPFDDTGGGSGGGPLVGAGGSDVIVGTGNSDEIRGMGGNDTLEGRAGDDTLEGGNGADVLVGGGGADTLRGGAGDDVLIGGGGNDVLAGGGGADTARFEARFAAVTITREGEVYRVAAPNGTDSLTGIEHLHFADVTLPVSAIFAPGDPGTGAILGTSGDDTLEGTEDDDTITALAGNDTLRGFGGDDILNAGDGTDTINGGDGDDTITGGSSSADRRDTIFGGAGNDSIDAGHGNDLVYGQDGNDTIAGGFGADELFGQDGNDVITGSAFSDLVFGGAGDDFVNGGFGFDRINGGTGADRFFHSGADGHASDWLQDYSAAEGDVLLFGNASASASDFVVRFAHTASAAGERSGDDAVEEAFVNYRGETLWALVDGAGEASINLQIGGEVFDLLA